MRNIKITLQYNGKNYCGWQKQPDSMGIQGNLEYAVNKITGEKVNINGSGRTDAGVHALAQVANFQTESRIPASKFPDALNSQLPKDISVIEAEEVDMEFHSRYSAVGKRYKYLIYNSRYRNPIIKDISYQVKYNLDVEKMKKEAESLIGTHDFKGFMSSGSSVENTVRTISDVEITQDGNLIVMEFEGNGFLYNMVRILSGTLVDIGRGKITDSMREIIDSKNRKRAGHTAPAHALFLKKVFY